MRLASTVGLLYSALFVFIGIDNLSLVSKGVQGECVHGDEPQMCSAGYSFLMRGKCIKVNTTAVKWQEASQACEKDGAEMLSLRSADATEALSAYRISVGQDQEDFWLDLHLLANGDFSWNNESKSIVYENFAEGAIAGAGSCAIVQTNTEWVRKDCNENTPFVCESTGVDFEPRPPNVTIITPATVGSVLEVHCASVFGRRASITWTGEKDGKNDMIKATSSITTMEEWKLDASGLCVPETVSILKTNFTNDMVGMKVNCFLYNNMTSCDYNGALCMSTPPIEEQNMPMRPKIMVANPLDGINYMCTAAVGTGGSLFMKIVNGDNEDIIENADKRIKNYTVVSDRTQGPVTTMSVLVGANESQMTSLLECRVRNDKLIPPDDMNKQCSQSAYCAFTLLTGSLTLMGDENGCAEPSASVVYKKIYTWKNMPWSVLFVGILFSVGVVVGILLMASPDDDLSDNEDEFDDEFRPSVVGRAAGAAGAAQGHDDQDEHFEDDEEDIDDIDETGV